MFLKIYIFLIIFLLYFFLIFLMRIFLDDLDRANKKLQQIENNNNTDVPTSSEIECTKKRKRKPNKRYEVISSDEELEFQRTSSPSILI